MKKLLKKLPFIRNYTTDQWAKWWEKRQIDWKVEYLDTADHPHRWLLTQILKTFPWFSLMEIGCGPGANLVNIVKGIPGRQIGGIDINPEAIELAEKTFNGGVFKCCSAEDIMMSDKATDVALTDMTLIYVSPWKIDKHLKELKRITRNYLVLCEFHSESWWDRLKLRINSGYNAYDYRKKLKKLGFYDIMVLKIPDKMWPGAKNDKFRHIIKARVPKRY